MFVRRWSTLVACAFAIALVPDRPAAAPSPGPSSPPPLTLSPPSLGMQVDPARPRAEVSGEDLRPTLEVQVRNGSGRTLWIFAEFTGGEGTLGSRSAAIAPRASQVVSVACDLSREIDLVVSVSAFADSLHVEALGSVTATARFDPEALRVHADKLAARRRALDAGKLPRRFDGVVLKTWFLPPRGTLDVTAESVRFSSAKRTVVIPAAALRRVRLGDAFRDKSLRLDYVENGRDRTLSLDYRKWSWAGIFTRLGDLPDPILSEIRTALERVMAARDLPEKAPLASDLATVPRSAAMGLGASAPDPEAATTFPTPPRVGVWSTAVLGFAGFAIEQDTTSEDPSSGLGLLIGGGVSWHVSPDHLVGVRLAILPTIGNTELVLVPVTMNATASLEDEIRLGQRWILAGGIGVGRYMTLGDKPLVGLMSELRLGWTGKSQGGETALMVTIQPCFYPGHRGIGFALGAQIHEPTRAPRNRVKK